MAIARRQILLTVALGLIFSGFSTTSALAEEKSEHSDAAEHGSHAGGHDHDAMKTEKEISKALATLSAAVQCGAVVPAEPGHLCVVSGAESVRSRHWKPQDRLAAHPVGSSCQPYNACWRLRESRQAVFVHPR